MQFREWLEAQGYEDFVNWLQKNGINTNVLINQLRQKPPDHRGGNADFWYIPNSEFGLRIVRGSGDITAMQKQNDPLADMNVGQPVANLGQGVQILKVQQGNPAGVKLGFHKMNHQDQQTELENFKQKVFQAAQMPQQAYDNLLKQIMTLNQRGYMIDPSKAGNILIDPNKGFNLVDISPKPSSYVNNAGDVIIMLMGGNYHYPKISSPEIQKASQAMIRKVEIASQKVGLPINKNYSSVQGSYQLAGLEKKNTPNDEENPQPQISASDVW